MARSPATTRLKRVPSAAAFGGGIKSSPISATTVSSVGGSDSSVARFTKWVHYLSFAFSS